MSFNIAQCPACESTFQVTARLLESASGKVRCGACLTIFTAPENLIEHEEESVFVGSHPNEFFDPSTFLTRQSLQDALRESQQAEQEQSEPEQADNADLAPESNNGAEQDYQHDEETVDNGQQSDDEQEFIAAVAAGIEENPATEADSSGFAESIAAASDAEALSTEPLQQTDDETAVGNRNEADPQNTASPATSHSPYSPYSPHTANDPDAVAGDRSPEAFRLHVSFSVDTSPYSSAQQNQQNADPVANTLPPTENTEPQPQSSSESEPELLIDWTEVIEGIESLQVTKSLDPRQQAEPGDATALGTSAQDTARAKLENGEDERHEDAIDQSVEAIRARALQAELKDEEALEVIPRENLQALGKFSTPVEILAGQPRSLRRKLTWAGLSLVAGLLLGAQYLWQELDRYSQNITLRPIYETACQWLDCELPVYADIDAIRASNLAVRSHPEVGNALTVNIEFQNFSPFAQRFPILVLSFNAANNSIIALREFAATEYLPEQLRGRQFLPPQTPLQINLSIIDPGDDAVNYTLAFRNP